MQEIYAEARRLLERGEGFILASVVATRGSTPQKPGAKLLVRADGSTAGTLGGGCVEASVWATAKEILRSGGGARVCEFRLNEELAAQDGLVCGGSMEILIDPVVDAPEFLPLVEEIVKALDGGGDRALATRASRSEHGERSARLFVREDGSTSGTLGDAELDRSAAATARDNMPTGREDTIAAGDDSLVYVEAFTSPATIVIAGGGHVGKALYTLAEFLGMRTIVIDDREEFANVVRFPAAHRVIVGPFDESLGELRMGPNHFVVVATRGHKWDDLALTAAARSGAGYVGLLGSKRKAVLMFRALFERGIPERRIRAIRSPVGLDLGGRQPAEIAVSVLAEIVAVRNGRAGREPPLSVGADIVSRVKEIASRGKD